MVTLEQYEPGLLPFIDYYYSDKSMYPAATTQGFIDDDNDFLIGDSGGLLMKMDFVVVDTYKFCTVADHFSKFGVYCFDEPDTVGYIYFWTNETDKRRKGVTEKCKLYYKDVDAYNKCKNDTERSKYLHDLHITGDHYNYLNYGRMMRTMTDEEKKNAESIGDYKTSTLEGFPRYWDYDYWNFKVDLFCSRNSLHAAKAKARRKGYSFKRGSQAANTVNLYPRMVIVLGAYKIDMLIDPDMTTQMAKKNLDWYETNTYWSRGFISENIEAIETGFKYSHTGNKKYGYQSKLISVSFFNDESAAIGKQAVEIDVEEAGKCPNLQEVLNVTLSNTEVGAKKVGTLRIYGTAGTKDANWAPFANAYYNPKANGMIAMENIWDKNARHSLAGFFHPNVANCEPYLDEHGNSLLISAYKFDVEDKKNALLNKPLSDAIIYIGQRANSPEEAFGGGVENLFTSAELTAHATYLKQTKDSIKYIDGMCTLDERGIVVFKSNDQLKDEGNKIHPYIEDVPFNPKKDIEGCYRIYDMPYKVDGIIPDNLYAFVTDPVGIDKDKTKVTSKNSLNASFIVRLPNNIVPNGTEMKIVASYVGRPNLMITYNKNLFYGAEYYNAKGLPEVDRGTVVADFKTFKALNRLYRDPTNVVNEKIADNSNASFGMVIGDTYKADDAILYLKELLYTPIGVTDEGTFRYVFHLINDIPLMQELLTYKKGGNFDRISALRLISFVVKYNTIMKKKATVKPKQTMLSSINLYGYRQNY